MPEIIAIKYLHDIYIGMLNPISVSLNNLQMPSKIGQKASYQTNPFVMNTLVADKFEHQPAIANVSFTSVDDSIVGKQIRTLGDVPCPYCGIRVIQGKELSHLNAENLGKTSKQAISLLKPFEDRMHPVEKQVFNLLEDLSKKNPQKNVRQLLDKVRLEHLESVKTQEYDILDRMSDYGKNIKNKDNEKELDELLNNSVDIIKKQDENYIFRRRRFMEKLNILTSKMDEKDKAQGLLNLAEELPRAHDNMSAFIVKFTQKDAKTKLEKTPYQIAISLVNPSVGSLEHIKPRHPQDGSTGGKDLYSNYTYASRDWNVARKNMPLDQWVTKHPEIKENSQKYIDAVIDKINNGQAMQKCRVYPILVAKTLEKESKGLIKLDISKLKLSKNEIATEMAKLKAETKIRETKKQQRIAAKNLSLVA